MIFEVPELTEADVRVLEQVDRLRSTLRYAIAAPTRWTGLLRRMLFARAIQGSNSIEGFNVTIEDAVAAIEGEEPFEAGETDWLAVNGYRQAMTYVLNLADDPHFTYSADLIRSLHFMMMQHELSKNPGRWRPGTVFVRTSSTGEIVYEGPEAARVPGLIDELIGFLNGSEDDHHPLIRAAMAHLDLVLIHPFSDGNGRMARCLQTLVLARDGILASPFSSIEEYLGRNTEDYYRTLAEVGGGYWQPSNDAHAWVRFCLTAHYRQARTVLRRVTEAERLWELLEGVVEQRSLPERVLVALFDAASGYRVRRASYQPAADISDNMASRDLKVLVDQGLLVPHGEKRGRYYTASTLVKELHSKILEVRLPIEDPFDPSSRTAPASPTT